MTFNRSRPWTDEEDRRLLELKTAGRSSLSIAVALRRSAKAIDGRASNLCGRKKATKDPAPADE